MDTVRDREPTCGFCEGSGLWADPDGGSADPCPLCDGAGVVAEDAATGNDEAAGEAAVPLARVLAVLSRLSPAERQRLYEELHARYDCRIYRY